MDNSSNVAYGYICVYCGQWVHWSWGQHTCVPINGVTSYTQPAVDLTALLEELRKIRTKLTEIEYNTRRGQGDPRGL